MSTLPVGVRVLIVVAPGQSQLGQGELGIVPDLVSTFLGVAVARSNQQRTVIIAIANAQPKHND